MMKRNIIIASVLAAAAMLAATCIWLGKSYRIADIISNEAYQDDRQMIMAAIGQQMADYPESTLKDIYKNFFQDALGPGHLMSGDADAEERMKKYLRRECEAAQSDIDPSPYYVRTGWHGRFYRVNLSVINEGKVPFDVFMGAFMESAGSFEIPEIEDWKSEWGMIENVLMECGYELPDFSEDSAAIHDMLDRGEYAGHHSRQYQKAYHPHYRLIEKDIFDREILPLLTRDRTTDRQ